MKTLSNLRIGSKIQLAIATNVILAILLGEFIVTQILGFTGNAGIAVNLAINGVIACVYGFIVSHAITKPLKEVVGVLHELSQGKGDLTHRFVAASNDEVGDLSRYFNTFLEKLHAIISEVSRSTCELSNVADEMRVTTVQSADNLKSQQQEANQAAVAMEEMANSVHEIARHACEAEHSACNADKGAHDGAHISSQARDEINALVEETESAAAAIETVANDVANIGKILDVIQEITEQTNLLALNAAIEAARAGEQGRGFAVVAGEVRTLANRTHDSTKEILDVITQLQSNAKQAVATMGTARQQAQTGSKHVAAAHQALNEIADSVKTISEMNTQIATAVGQQKTTTAEVSHNIAFINQISKNTAKSADEITATSQRLFNMSQQLERLIGQFELV